MSVIEWAASRFQDFRLRNSPDNPLDALQQMVNTGEAGPYNSKNEPDSYRLLNQLYAIEQLSECGSSGALEILSRIYEPEYAKLVTSENVAFFNPDTYVRQSYDLYQTYPNVGGPLARALTINLGSGVYDEFSAQDCLPDQEEIDQKRKSGLSRQPHKIIQKAIKSLEESLQGV